MRTRTIQFNLFVAWSLIIFAILASVTVFFYVWASDVLTSRAYDRVGQLGQSLKEQLDTQVRQMDTVSNNICYSNLVKDRLEQSLSGFAAPTAISQASEKELIEMLVAINGPSMPVKQIYLYSNNGYRFGTGFDNRQEAYNFRTESWAEEVTANSGRKTLSLPFRDENLSRIISANRGIVYLSLFRSFINRFNGFDGVVEVRQYYDTVFGGLADFASQNSEKVFVFNENGVQMYPWVESTGPLNAPWWKAHLAEAVSSRHFVSGISGEGGSQELMTATTSDYSHWTVVLIASEKTLMAPVTSLTRTLIVIAAGLLLLALIASFLTARKFTRPIARLNRDVHAMDLTNPAGQPVQVASSGVRELDQLREAFDAMTVKLRRSLDELLLSQQQELQSKALALQSQMNPHFLYNTLATLSAMADEGMNDEISDMCAYVSDMLRYIGNDESPIVPIASELAYTEKYLACMKMRHQDKLSYSLSMPPELLSLEIPKLVLQPLVENAIKYGTQTQPPWHISITGECDEHLWQIRVSDNGPGFSDESLADLAEKFQRISAGEPIPALSLDGMGLLNIYTRLKILYQKKMTFAISRSAGCGSTITIGGTRLPVEDR